MKLYVLFYLGQLSHFPSCDFTVTWFCLTCLYCFVAYVQRAFYFTVLQLSLLIFCWGAFCVDIFH